MLNGGEGLRRSIDINDEDHPIAGQIIGSEPGQMAQAASILHQAGYDVIDLNFACPVKKIKNKARGGHMLSDSQRGVEILKAVRDALPPAAITTVSLRRGFDDSQESSDRMYRILDTAWEWGYAAAQDSRPNGGTEVPGQEPLGSRRRGEAAVSRQDDPRQWRHFLRRRCRAHAARNGRGHRLDRARRHRQSVDLPARQDAAGRRRASSSAPPPSTNSATRCASISPSPWRSTASSSPAGACARWASSTRSFHPLAEQVKRDFIEITSLRGWQAVLDMWYSADGGGVWPAANAADEVNEAFDAPASCP